MAIADELIALLGYKFTGEAEGKKYEAGLKRLEGVAERVGAAIGTALKVGAVAAAGALAYLGKNVISTSAQFEGYQATLETIEGSAEKAKASLAWISKFGKTTPYDVAQVTEAFVKLKSYGIDPIADDALRTLGDTASGMGKPLNQAVEAFADASTMQFERLREFGITSAQKGDQVTFAWTKNGKAMTQVVKKNSEDIRAFLLNTMGEQFGGAMERQSKTWNGMLSNLGDTWTDFMLRIGNAGFFESMKGKLQGVLDQIQRLDDNGTLDRWAKSLSQTLEWVSNVIFAIFTRTAENITFLIENFDRLKPVIYTVGIALGALLAYLFPITAGFFAAAILVDDFLSYLQGGDSVIGDFIEWIKRLPEVLTEAAAAFKNWLSNVDWGALGSQAGALLVDGIVLAVTTYVGLWHALQTAIIDAFKNIDYGAVWGVVVAGLEAYVDFFLGFWKGIGVRVKDLIKEWFDIDLVAIGQKMGQDILSGLQSMGAAIKQWLVDTFKVPDWITNWSGNDKVAPNPNAVPAGMNDNQPVGNQTNWQKLMENAGENMQKLAPDQAIDATITDSRSDNRNQSINPNININQTITQATDAPTRAAQATGAAVRGSVAAQRSQVEAGPSF